MSRDFGPNLLQPLSFEEGRAEQFARRHVCNCGGHLITKHAPGRTWIVECGLCGVAITANGYVSKGNWERHQQGVEAGLLELRERGGSPRSIDSVLKDLGL